MQAKRSRGRPHSVNLQAARLVGDKTYEGKRCKRCGGTERYTKGCGCVACQKSNAIEARQLLAAARRDSAKDLDFLGDYTVEALATIGKAKSIPRKNLNYEKENRVEGGSGINNYKMENRGECKNAVLPSQPQPDPEPICPECGCNVDAEYVERGGWLQRCTPWKCTVCDWTGGAPPPVGESGVDNLDFLG